jgi:hypothetical protein
MTASAFAIAAAFAVAGLAFGSAYFAALRRTTELLAGSGAWLWPAVWTLGRLLAAIVFLAFAAKLGALPLLTALAGFLAARALALRAVRRVA